FATTPLICLECIKEGRDDNGTSVIGASESVNSTSYALFEDKSILGDQEGVGMGVCFSSFLTSELPVLFS
ncbi:hypothetical protein Tco_0279437, partial [Tanacetum coccineum]